MNQDDTIAAMTQVAIAFVGQVDSGKSSFIGVCTTGKLDNGKGSARASVAKHKHEIDVGKTSDISTRVLKLDDGRVITFIDLCGHEKYLKTTVRGISGHFPDYSCLIISPQRGVQEMTKQHYKVLMSQNIPIIIIITRADVCEEQSYNETTSQITTMLRSYGRQTSEFINTYQEYLDVKSGAISKADFEEKKLSDTDKIIENLKFNKAGKQAIVPVVTVSNVDGHYMDVCKNVMHKLEPRDIWNQDSRNNRIIKVFLRRLKLQDSDIKTDFDGSVFYIDTFFTLKGIGLVASGITRGDPVSVNDVMYMGPFGKDFLEVRVKSIHNNNRQHVSVLKNHDRGCVNIKFVKSSVSMKKENIRKGVKLVTKNQIENICYRFKAAIFVFDKSVSISPGYSPVINTGTISQTARVLEDETFTEIVSDGSDGTQRKVKKTMGPGSIASMWFKFKRDPEHVVPGSLLTFRSGEIHGVGIILETLPIGDDADAKPDVLKKNKHKNKKPSIPTLTTQKYKEPDIKL